MVTTPFASIQLSSSTFAMASRPPPDLDIPISISTVTVRVVDSYKASPPDLAYKVQATDDWLAVLQNHISLPRPSLVLGT